MVKAWLLSLRPSQWIKNLLILAALVFDRQLFQVQSLLHSLIGVVLFCLVSSSIYQINDLVDREADRNHPKKKFRPIASGALPIPVAITSAIFLGLISLIGAFVLSPGFGQISLLYFILQIAYSFFLKRQPIIDVMVIAFGFLVRVAAGVTLITVERFSPWLYVCTGLLSLYIGFGKRRSELVTLEESAGIHRISLRGYNLPLLDQLITVVSATTLMAYSLYTFSAPNLPENNSMMLTIPFVAYGIFRYHYLIQVEGSGGAPEDIILKDRPLQVTVGLWGISVIVIFYLLNIVK
ncbi:MAG: decaprenyl-phosphate phosphoribosyltransferase [Anaerolineae bacterium]|nr:decaprenyl-phosphate phosphoribosyltransferase [Anaerolineae bacterium]